MWKSRGAARHAEAMAAIAALGRQITVLAAQFAPIPAQLKMMELQAMKEWDQVLAEMTEQAKASDAVKLAVDQVCAKLAAIQDAPTPAQIAGILGQLKANRDKMAAATIEGTAAAGELGTGSAGNAPTGTDPNAPGSSSGAVQGSGQANDPGAGGPVAADPAAPAQPATGAGQSG